MIVMESRDCHSLMESRDHDDSCHVMSQQLLTRMPYLCVQLPTKKERSAVEAVEAVLEEERKEARCDDVVAFNAWLDGALCMALNVRGRKPWLMHRSSQEHTLCCWRC